MRILATYISLIVVIFSSCGSGDCEVDTMDDLRGTWLQVRDLYDNSSSVAVYYEFSLPSIFRVYYESNQDSVSMLSGFPSLWSAGRVDPDQCLLGWYNPSYPDRDNTMEWRNLRYQEDQLVVDFVLNQSDSLVAQDVILTRVK